MGLVVRLHLTAIGFGNLLQVRDGVFLHEVAVHLGGISIEPGQESLQVRQVAVDRVLTDMALVCHELTRRPEVAVDTHCLFEVRLDLLPIRRNRDNRRHGVSCVLVVGQLRKGSSHLIQRCLELLPIPPRSGVSRVLQFVLDLIHHPLGDFLGRFFRPVVQGNGAVLGTLPGFQGYSNLACLVLLPRFHPVFRQVLFLVTQSSSRRIDSHRRIQHRH